MQLFSSKIGGNSKSNSQNKKKDKHRLSLWQFHWINGIMIPMKCLHPWRLHPCMPDKGIPDMRLAEHKRLTYAGVLVSDVVPILSAASQQNRKAKRLIISNSFIARQQLQ